jgi:hypothetical protein
VQLAKLHVHGMLADVDAARGWYEKAGDLGAIAAMEEFVRVSATATEKPAIDLTQFRAAYISGDGLAYVVINEEKGQQIYRYGDVSRSAAKKDGQTFTLYICDTPHVFTLQKPQDLAALLNATVVKPGDFRLAELDAKYLSGCNNRLLSRPSQKVEAEPTTLAGCVDLWQGHPK